jgi:esterase
VTEVALELAHDAFGEAGAPVVILHGLLGSARNWATMARELAATHRVFALDLRNHGRSPWAESMSFDEMAGDVAAFIERQDLSQPTVLGHSLGGKVAMRLALTRAEQLARLIVVDVAPVVYRHSFGEYVEAMRAVNLGEVSRRVDVDQRLHAAVPDAMTRAFLLQNLVRTAEGGYAWRANLDVIAASLPTLMGFPAGDDLVYGGPALFLAGGRSTYVRPEYRPVIERLFPKAEQATIVGAGHRVHADRPDEFLARVRQFLG